jgi:hypothetical protein
MPEESNERKSLLSEPVWRTLTRLAGIPKIPTNDFFNRAVRGGTSNLVGVRFACQVLKRFNCGKPVVRRRAQTTSPQQPKVKCSFENRSQVS